MSGIFLSTSFNLTNMYNGKIILRKTEKNN